MSWAILSIVVVPNIEMGDWQPRVTVSWIGPCSAVEHPRNSMFPIRKASRKASTYTPNMNRNHFSANLTPTKTIDPKSGETFVEMADIDNIDDIIRLGCPFCRRNPERYKKCRSCNGAGFTELSQVKYVLHCLAQITPRNLTA